MDIQNFYYKHHTTVLDIPTYIINFYDLTLVLKGELNYKINGKKVSVKKNDAILIPPNSKRERLDPSGSVVEYVSFNFNSTTPVILPILTKHFVDSNFTHLLSLCDSIQPLFPNKEITNNIVEIILLLIKNKIKEERFHPVTKKILEYIDENFKNKITMEDITKNVMFSESYCNASFKKDIGCPIIQFVLRKKLSLAKKYLIEGILSVKEISDELGFDDPNYFSRIFKKATNLSPLQYKKRYNN